MNQPALCIERANQADNIPIAELIQTRAQQLGLNFEEIGFRLGYLNPAKAAGRVHALCRGHLTSRKSKEALARLPDALELPDEVVERAVNATAEQIAEHQRGLE